MIRFIIHGILFIGLTVLTQIGGLWYLLMLGLTRGFISRIFTFVGIYGLISVGALFSDIGDS